MNKKIITGLMILAMSAGNISAVMAETTTNIPTATEQQFMKTGFEMHLEKMAEVLNLTDAQKEQIKAIFEAEKTNNEATMQQLSEIRKQIKALAATETFDETAVRALAEQSSKLRVELIVSHAKVQNHIYNILTAEQKALASKIEPLMKGHGGPGAGGL